jgi:DNA-binding response OmpR family regulator
MRNILIAEDEPRISSFLAKGFQKEGFQTSVVNNGIEAVHTLERGKFDVLLLDLGLPGKDGWEVLDEVRGYSNELLVIIVTARDGFTDRQESLMRGATDYVTKPFNFKFLLSKVKSHLES